MRLRFQEKFKRRNRHTGNHSLLAFVPLNPRDLFFGGCTGPIKTYRAEEGEKIKYIYNCFLYPWVCKNGKFPVEHPQLYVGVDYPLDLQNIERLIKYKVLLPQDLFHPVLHHVIKLHNKLIFTLCRTCAETENINCEHNDEARVLSWTWVINEVLEVVEK